MQDQLGKSFGLVIAFLVPGMIALYGASLHVKLLEDWFEIAANARSTTVGGVLLIVVASLGMGVFVSNLRWLVLERWIWRRTPPELPNAHRRRETQTELVYQNLVWQYYQFYQFSANSLFALVLLYGAWLAHELRPEAEGLRPAPVALALPTILLVPTGCVLYVAAKDSLNRYNKRRDSVLKFPVQGDKPVSEGATGVGAGQRSSNG